MTSPFAPARPHIIVLNRWRDSYARYADYVDHSRCAVSYITTDLGKESVPAAAVEVVVVPDLDDAARLRKETAHLVDSFGLPEAIVALKEEDLLAAAHLGERYGLAQRTTDDLLPLRDKLIMAERAARAGVRVPAFAPAPDRAAVAAFAQTHGYPLVLKPRLAAASADVQRLDNPADLQDYSDTGDWPTHLLVQVWNADPIFHIDGIWDGQRLAPWRASRYLNASCMDFLNGAALCSVEVDDARLLDAIAPFSTQVMRALTDKPTALHLELFVHDDRRTTPTCTLLEVGGRVGGADIPFVWRDVHGYDLLQAAFHLALGKQPPTPPPATTAEVAGWMLAAPPAQRPCRIEDVSPMARPGNGPWPYAEHLPKVGTVVPAGGTYEHVGGRFRFRGPTTRAVTRAIAHTAAHFTVAASPLPPDTDHW